MELDEYGNYLSNRRGRNMHAVLAHVVKEIKNPFRDYRREYSTTIDDLDVMYCLSGEQKQNFKEGSIINAKILQVSDRGLKVRTDSGIIGYIKISCIDDERKSFTEEEL